MKLCSYHFLNPSGEVVVLDTVPSPTAHCQWFFRSKHWTELNPIRSWNPGVILIIICKFVGKIHRLPGFSYLLHHKDTVKVDYLSDTKPSLCLRSCDVEVRYFVFVTAHAAWFWTTCKQVKMWSSVPKIMEGNIEALN